MFNIIENPETKELYFKAQGTLYDYDGTPHRNIDITDWKVISQATCVADWYDYPGIFGVYHCQATLAITDDNNSNIYQVGGPPHALREWVEEIRKSHKNSIVSISNEKAYSTRIEAKDFNL